jgi:A/G-specific adenine glycosylase
MTAQRKSNPIKIDGKTRRAFQEGLVAWYHRHRRDLPWRRDPTPYAVAVSEFMCQQTQIATVLPYFDRWMKCFPDWRALASAREEAVLKMWEGLGYYRRARMLHGLAAEVVARGGELPAGPDELKTFRGIGAYTAGAIASIAFGRRAAVVDGNVERVLCRVFDFDGDLSKTATRKTLWVVAESLLPEAGCGDFNQALMELGATVCTPRQPDCAHCPLHRVCRVKEPESLPVKKREKSIEEKEILAFIIKDNRLWLELPKMPKRWKGVYRLPMWDEARMERGEEILVHRYGVTKYRIEARVVRARPKGTLRNGKWFAADEWAELFLPAPHRKMIGKALETV